MSLLGRFTKQPDEILDYDLDFTDFFEGRSDTPASFTVTAETGITVVGSSRTGNVVKVILSGGVSGTAYKITVLLTTSTGIKREGDFQVTVKAT